MAKRKREPKVNRIDQNCEPVSEADCMMCMVMKICKKRKTVI